MNSVDIDATPITIIANLPYRRDVQFILNENWLRAKNIHELCGKWKGDALCLRDHHVITTHLFCETNSLH